MNIIIIDDNKEFCQSMEYLINGQESMNCLGVFHTFESGINSGAIEYASILLLDIELPDVKGNTALPKLKRFPQLNTIMCSVYEDEENIFLSLKNEAVGYVIKDSEPSYFIDAIHAVSLGGSFISPKIARKIIHYFYDPSLSGKEKVQLSEKETHILQQLSEGYTYKEIAEQIYLSTDGIKYHIKNTCK